MIYAQIMCYGNGEACNDLRINNNFKLTSIITVSYYNSTNCLAVFRTTLTNNLFTCIYEIQVKSF